jgi:hypothetical protein
MALLPAYLPQLRLLCLEKCNDVCGKDIAELMAALPELVVINRERKIVGELRDKHLEAVCSKLAPISDRVTTGVYDIIRQWALDR